jgi:allantoicase
MNNPKETELQTAKAALWEIAKKRLTDLVDADVFSRPFKRHGIAAAQICFTQSGEQLSLGEAQEKMHFEVASLSKTVASAFAVEFLRSKNISLEESVNSLLASAKSPFKLLGPWGDLVKVKHLMNHQALNMHYVFGVEGSEMPPITDFLESKHGYGAVEVLHPPGSKFKYSGAGFIVLEHLIESLSGQKIFPLTRKFLDDLGMQDFTFAQHDQSRLLSTGRRDDGTKVQLMFPAFAAGAMGTAKSIANFLNHLTRAYHDLAGSGPLSHDTARTMLHGSDLGCREFMGATMGLGVFIVEADQNRYMVHQGANDGYRCLYLHCFAGPNRGEGVVSLSTGDLKGVFFHAEVAQEFLKLTCPHGVNPALFQTDFSFKGLKQEEIVNIGYRDLIFKAFEKTRAEEIVVKGARTPYGDQSALFEAEIVSCTNDLFARAENLLSPYEPIFDPELFGKQGKIMDSWESVRHNPLPWDELHLRLKKKSKVRYALLSTKYHTANHAPYVKLVGLVNGAWQTLLDTEMEGHSLKLIDLESQFEISELKVQMIPDGGFSRLMLFETAPAGLSFAPAKIAKCSGFQEKVPTTKKPLTLTYYGGLKPLPKGLVNVASLAYGAQVIEASNEHYGPAAQAISPYIPLNMFDGMESARSRKPGSFEFITIKLATECELETVEVDFTYFVNNNPRELSIEAKVNGQWKELVSKTYVKSFAGSKKEFPLTLKEKISELKVKAHPCGGLHRVKAFARIL